MKKVEYLRIGDIKFSRRATGRAETPRDDSMIGWSNKDMHEFMAAVYSGGETSTIMAVNMPYSAMLARGSLN